MSLSDFDLPGPTQPIKFNGCIPVYTKRQVELYGIPDTYGIPVFEIIETREDQEFFAYIPDSDKKVHHYDRVKRFEAGMFLSVTPFLSSKHGFIIGQLR